MLFRLSIYGRNVCLFIYVGPLQTIGLGPPEQSRSESVDRSFSYLVVKYTGVAKHKRAAMPNAPYSRDSRRPGVRARGGDSYIESIKARLLLPTNVTVAASFFPRAFLRSSSWAGQFP